VNKSREHKGISAENTSGSIVLRAGGGKYVPQYRPGGEESIPRVCTPAQRTGLNIWEVEIGKVAVVFSSRSIVGFGGVDFIVEVAEAIGFFVGCNLCGPFFICLVPVDAFVF
jgi:hypothetical protein